MLRRLWRELKISRRLSLGPVSLFFRFERAVKVSNGIDRSHSRPLREEREQDLAPPSGDRIRDLAIVVGVGEGFGYALARKLARNGFDLIMVARDANRLQALVLELHELGANVEAYGADATDENSVGELFDHACRKHGVPCLVVYAVQHFGPGAASEVEVPAFETAWRHNCLGAFLVSRRAAAEMVPRHSGSIVFIGSTSSIVGRAAHLNLAVGKFGQRALAQVMARELWPKGIHVAHVLIDADISEPSNSGETTPQANPADIADAVLSLHRQARTAWTSELDLRPWNEAFWEHC
jgi:NAD(P)-dependent dehydrogenase (short-subunit alcohol dehydrogenase family)